VLALGSPSSAFPTWSLILCPAHASHYARFRRAVDDRPWLRVHAHARGNRRVRRRQLITTKVKTAIFNAPDLKSPEIKVQTFKGVVQLSGFVSSRHEIDGAMRVARTVGGVKAVTNEMQLK
jgi:hypothetical protein